jgi:hypothetical protein
MQRTKTRSLVARLLQYVSSAKTTGPALNNDRFQSKDENSVPEGTAPFA